MTNSPPLKRQKAPDGGWGWIVVFGSFMVGLVCDGFSYTSGMLYEEFLVVYKESEAITSLFDSIMTGMLFATGPLASGLTAAYGCRTVAIFGTLLSVTGMLLSVVFDSIYTHCLTLGVMTGSGMGLIFLPQIVIISHWFDKRLTFATGIAVCGTGFGMAIFAVLNDYLIHTFGWKGSMILLSGLMFTNVFFASLFRKPDDQNESQSLKSALKETFNFRILSEPLYIYYAFAYFLSRTVYYVPIIFLKDHIKKIGAGTDGDGVKMLVVLGIFNAIGRVLFGYIANRNPLNRTLIYGMSIITYGITMGIMAAIEYNLGLIMVGTAIFGIAEGAYVCLTSVVMVDLFGVHKISNVFGLTNMISGIASFIGPPLIGKTVDEKTGYRTGFYISSVITIISGILNMFLPIIQRKYKCYEN